MKLYIYKDSPDKPELDKLITEYDDIQVVSLDEPMTTTLELDDGVKAVGLSNISSIIGANLDAPTPPETIYEYKIHYAMSAKLTMLTYFSEKYQADFFGNMNIDIALANAVLHLREKESAAIASFDSYMESLIKVKRKSKFKSFQI